MKLDIDKINFLEKKDFYNTTNGKYHDDSNFIDERVVKEKYKNRILPACYVINENLIKFSNNETDKLNDVFYDFISAHIDNKVKRLRKEGLIK